MNFQNLFSSFNFRLVQLFSSLRSFNVLKIYIWDYWQVLQILLLDEYILNICWYY